MSETDKPQEPMTIVTIDSEIVQCKAKISGLKARLKVLQKARKNLESGVGEDAALAGRVEEGMPDSNDDSSNIGGSLGSASRL
jgi:hypothetical protein